MKKPSLFLAGIACVLGTSYLWAYDVHHPNPMSILNGRHHAHSHRRAKPKIRVKKVKKVQTTRSRLQPWRMHKRHSEGRYIIKPEPYSIAKKQDDPELLGPQRTYSSEDREHNRTATTTADTDTQPITPQTCIDKLGKEKYDSYVQKYGGEAGAIQRCRILLRAHS